MPLETLPRFPGSSSSANLTVHHSTLKRLLLQFSLSISHVHGALGFHGLRWDGPVRVRCSVTHRVETNTFCFPATCGLLFYSPGPKVFLTRPRGPLLERAAGENGSGRARTLETSGFPVFWSMMHTYTNKGTLQSRFWWDGFLFWGGVQMVRFLFFHNKRRQQVKRVQLGCTVVRRRRVYHSPQKPERGAATVPARKKQTGARSTHSVTHSSSSDSTRNELTSGPMRPSLASASSAEGNSNTCGATESLLMQAACAAVSWAGAGSTARLANRVCGASADGRGGGEHGNPCSASV